MASDVPFVPCRPRAGANSAIHGHRGPCRTAIDLRKRPQGRALDARVPNAGTRMCRREAPKVDCELAGQATAWMPEVEQRKEQLPEARRASGRGGLLFGYISLTPGSCPPPSGPAPLFAPLLRRSGHSRES